MVSLSAIACSRSWLMRAMSRSGPRLLLAMTGDADVVLVHVEQHRYLARREADRVELERGIILLQPLDREHRQCPGDLVRCRPLRLLLSGVSSFCHCSTS